MGNSHTAEPDSAVVVDGGLCLPKDARALYTDGSHWVSCFAKVQRLPLRTFTVQPECVGFSGVVQCAIVVDANSLSCACDHFLGESDEQIEKVLLEELENRLSKVVATLDGHKDAGEVAEMAQKDASVYLRLMGFGIISYSIR
ncbi:hypothetical protein CAPTEDRAFT_201104 [Capitella teleta]|uniref:Uncharacterized protein n=1 Tax=Capitella teleta TaxID=283909 RepID=R7UKJ4_CAPTE|nr:hypothetical protein CAPTEDRAFT_201104 [Capitella teleta]|eukprot:ELU04323.1 hypothetical protein CAPTEDRAFT_201104 [Capitella teleta]